MTNDVPLIKHMDVRFEALEHMVDRRFTNVEEAVTHLVETSITEKRFEECFNKLGEKVETLNGKRQGHEKRIDNLEGFRGVVYKIGGVLLTIAMALVIAGLTGLLF